MDRYATLALVSAVAGPRSCGIACPNGTPATAISFATRSDSNAESMESVWRTAMPIVGNARCGEGTVNFYSPPGADEMGFLGGVKFYVSIGGEKYSEAATFSCGEPGGWLRQRDMFVDSFRDNPASTFPE